MHLECLAVRLEDCAIMVESLRAGGRFKPNRVFRRAGLVLKEVRPSVALCRWGIFFGDRSPSYLKYRFRLLIGRSNKCHERAGTEIVMLHVNREARSHASGSTTLNMAYTIILPRLKARNRTNTAITPEPNNKPVCPRGI